MEKTFLYSNEDDLKRKISENSSVIDQLLKELKESAALLTLPGEKTA